jgi:hypothetical protein
MNRRLFLMENLRMYGLKSWSVSPVWLLVEDLLFLLAILSSPIHQWKTF